MSIEAWLAFVAATAIVVVIPGPTILIVISYSMSHGRRARLPLVAAVTSGDSTALAVFASSAASFPASRRAKQGFDIAGGSLLSIAGAWALLAKRATS